MKNIRETALKLAASKTLKLNQFVPVKSNRLVPVLLTLTALNTGLLARAQVTYTYTGNNFSYVGGWGPVHNISGSFTLSYSLAPNTTYELDDSFGNFTPLPLPAGTVWGPTMTDFSFTDGRETAVSSQSSAYNPPLGGDITSGNPYSEPIFQVTTGPSGNISSWFINILTPNALITTINGSYKGSTQIYDNINGDASQPYDAYIYNSPGTWSSTDSTTATPEPGTLALAGVGAVFLRWSLRQRK